MIKPDKSFGGLLFHRFNNSKKQDDYSSVRKINKRKNENSQNKDSEPNNKVVLLPKNEIISRNWLKVNRHPKSTAFAHLENTFNARRNDRLNPEKALKSFLDEWPIFKSPEGSVFVS